MGFYAPDSLLHEAENRGIPMLGLDVNASAVQCTVQNGAVRLGLGYIKDATEAEMRGLVAERERTGRFRSLGEVAARSGCRRVTLEQLAWSGACDSLLSGQDRRSALWQLGMATPARTFDDDQGGSTGAAQLALPLELPASPRLRRLGRWQRLIADYSTSGVTIGDHAMAILRGRLTVPKLATSAQLARLPAGCDIALAGLVIARQRPGTANGTMFLLFEDEFGTVNLIVPREVYERRRHLARAEPLLLARGRLERHQEGSARTVWGVHELPGRAREADGEEIRPVINVLVRELEPLERFLDGGLQEGPGVEGTVHPLHGARPGEPAEGERADGAEVASSMRAVAPPIQSFATGRRR